MRLPLLQINTVLRFVRNKWTLVVVVITSFLILVQFARLIPWPWYISINETKSLPYKVFIVIRNHEPTLGDYIDFWPPENEFYSGISFIKQVVAETNDFVECNDRERLIDNKIVAIAKEESINGRKLHLGPCGLVPKGHLFVLAPHRDSFDSRYREIGYVPFEAVRGVAYPLF